MGRVRFGPAFLPSHESPDEAVSLRAEPLAEALARFERPATVISESPDEASTRAIGALLARVRSGR